MLEYAPGAAPSRGGSTHRRAALAVAFGMLVLPRAAAAQTQQELATRRILIEQATAERRQGHHAQALTLAQSAGAVRMTPSVRLFIAQELDATGDPAGALGLAHECVREVERDRSVAHRAALLATCQELETVTRTRIGYLVVRAPEGPVDGLRVTVQGAALNLALLSVPNVVSPGALAVEASAPGRLPFTASPVVEPGATVEVTLALPPEPVAPPVVVAAPVVVAPPAVVAHPVPVVRVRRLPMPIPRSPNRVAPALLLGGGGAALVGGAVLLAVRASALDGCTVQGSAVECDTVAELDAARGANGLAAGAGILLGVGAVAVGAGALWLLLARGTAARPAQLTAGVAPVPGGVTFGLTGRFL